MTIQADLTDEVGNLTTECMAFEEAWARWPWIGHYTKALEAGVAVFAAEGQFYRMPR